MIAHAEILQFKSVVCEKKNSNIFFSRLNEILNGLTTLNDQYFDTHRDVDWSNSHTQHSKHENYDRY